MKETFQSIDREYLHLIAKINVIKITVHVQLCDTNFCIVNSTQMEMRSWSLDFTPRINNQMWIKKINILCVAKETERDGAAWINIDITAALITLFVFNIFVTIQWKIWLQKMMMMKMTNKQEEYDGFDIK